MKFPHLTPVLDSLVFKYREIGFKSWESSYDRDESFHDYSENADDPCPNETFWQAHTHVLEINQDEKGRYAFVSISVFPRDVHSVPPAPSAALFVYESGVCDISTPWSNYSYVQKK
jgi:hypothetical protein